MSATPKLPLQKPSCYFSYVSHETQCKNKLELEVLDYLRHLKDRQVIPASGLKKFKADILEVIECANKMHPRCKPITNAHWHENLAKKGDSTLHLDFVVYYILAEHLHYAA